MPSRFTNICGQAVHGLLPRFKNFLPQLMADSFFHQQHRSAYSEALIHSEQLQLIRCRALVPCLQKKINPPTWFNFSLSEPNMALRLIVYNLLLLDATMLHHHDRRAENTATQRAKRALRTDDQRGRDKQRRCVARATMGAAMPADERQAANQTRRICDAWQLVATTSSNSNSSSLSPSLAPATLISAPHSLFIILTIVKHGAAILAAANLTRCMCNSNFGTQPLHEENLCSWLHPKFGP